MSERIVGRYRLERLLGEGGMGKVYLARHPALEIEVAIKELAPHLAQDKKFRRRFLQEGRAQAQLRHPHIVEVKDLIEDGSGVFLVMEYMPRGSLEQAIESAGGPLEPDWVVTRAKQVLHALDFAHQSGVIHRDVKPSNILLDAAGDAKITDFGIAIVLGARRLTATGTTLGTPFYMSPEQIKNSKRIDHRADVYSMGAVLYEALTGAVPFDGDSDFSIQLAHVNETPPPPRERNPAIPLTLEAVVLRALAKDPGERFTGCGELARALDADPRPAAVTPPPRPAPEPVAAPVREPEPAVRPPARAGTDEAVATEPPYAFPPGQRARFVRRHAWVSAVTLPAAFWTAIGGFASLLAWEAGLFSRWVAMLAFFVSGVALALGSWWTARPRLDLGVSWILAHGYFTTAVFTLGYVLEETGLFFGMTWEPLYALLSFGALLVLPALILRRRVNGAWWWPAGSLLGWMVAMVAMGLVAVVVDEMLESATAEGIGIVLLFGVTGASVGLCQAWVLVRLRKKPEAPEAPSAERLLGHFVGALVALTLIALLLP